MDVPLIIAGLIAVASAALHVAGGEALMRRVSPEFLPPQGPGGQRQTQMEIHINWQWASITFLLLGVGLLLSGSVLDGDSARALGLFAAATVTCFAVLAAGLVAGYMRSLRSVLLTALPPRSPRLRCWRGGELSRYDAAERRAPDLLSQ